MNFKEKLEDLMLLGKEVCLELLKIADKELRNSKKMEDKEKEKSILVDVIPYYERIYAEFDRELDKYDINEEMIEKVEGIVYKLLEENKLDEEKLWDNVRVRIELEGNSGAEAVKNLFEFQLEDIKDEINKLLSVEKELLDKQKKFEMDLADAIQEIEELEAFDKVKKNSNKIDKIGKKLEELEIKVSELEYNIRTKWRFEIYGTISKEKVLEIYKDVI